MKINLGTNVNNPFGRREKDMGNTKENEATIVKTKAISFLVLWNFSAIKRGFVRMEVAGKEINPEEFPNMVLTSKWDMSRGNVGDLLFRFFAEIELRAQNPSKTWEFTVLGLRMGYLGPNWLTYISPIFPF